MATRKRQLPCSYCDRPASTRDHIPPGLLFPSPRPADLITVPCCGQCNREAQRDDEYFRMMLTFSARTGENPHAKRVGEAVIRGLQRRAQDRLRKAVLRNVRVRSLRSPAGIFLGRLPAYNVDLTRLNRVPTRMVKGLFRHEFERVFPKTAKATTLEETGLVDADAGMLDELRRLLGTIAAGPERRIGDGRVFRYQFTTADDNPDATAWLLTFFDSIPFLGMTVPSGNAST